MKLIWILSIFISGSCIIIGIWDMWHTYIIAEQLDVRAGAISFTTLGIFILSLLEYRKIIKREYDQ